MGHLSTVFLWPRSGRVAAIGTIKAVYPAAWGALQVFTGPLSDRWGRKWLIAGGMIVQAGAIWLTVALPKYPAWIVAALLQGVGTAMVYPTLLAAISDVAHPEWRASTMGVYRFWRDLGYAVGALISGIIADLLGMRPHSSCSSANSAFRHACGNQNARNAHPPSRDGARGRPGFTGGPVEFRARALEQLEVSSGGVVSSKHIAIVRSGTGGLVVGNEPRQVIGMPSRTGVYRFGPLQLDVHERRLLRDGAQVPLRLKAFETLRVCWWRTPDAW